MEIANNIRLVIAPHIPAWISDIALAAAKNNDELPDEIADLFTLNHVGTHVSHDGADVYTLDFAE